MRDFYGWVITTTDGLRYEFGDIAYGDYLPYDPADPNSVNQTFASANAYALEQSDGWESYRLTRRWYLRKVTDPSGNSLEYTYRAERRAKTCQVQDEGDDNWVKKGLNWYTSSVDPVEIAWSGNATADSPVPYRLRVHFTYASTARSDTVVRNDEPHECDAGYATQPLLSAWNQLSSIEVQAYSEDWEDGIANNGAWQTLRSYQLNQAPTPINVHGRTFVRNTLTSVEEKGRDGSVLRRTSFTYNLSNVNQVWLGDDGGVVRRERPVRAPGV